MATQQEVGFSFDQVSCVLRCKSCRAMQAVLKGVPPEEQYVTLEPDTPVPSHIKIEPVAARWCSSCDDQTRILDFRVPA